jgi:hypothetical protein
MLRRPTIVHGDHTTAGAQGEQPADRVVRLQVADHPAAAMNPQDRPRGVLGHVAAGPDRARRSRTLEVLHGRQLGTGADELGDHPGRLTGLLRRQLIQRRRSGSLHASQERLRLRTKGHFSLLWDARTRAILARRSSRM